MKVPITSTEKGPVVPAGLSGSDTERVSIGIDEMGLPASAVLLYTLRVRPAEAEARQQAKKATRRMG